MTVLLVLIGGTLASRIFLKSWAAAIRAGLAAMFLFTGASHFTPVRHDLAAIVPPWIPRPGLVVLLTGVLEIMGAIGLLIPKTRKAAAWCLIAFLVAVFPANIYAAKAGLSIGGTPATPLIPRLSAI